MEDNLTIKVRMQTRFEAFPLSAQLITRASTKILIVCGLKISKHHGLFIALWITSINYLPKFVLLWGCDPCGDPCGDPELWSESDDPMMNSFMAIALFATIRWRVFLWICVLEACERGAGCSIGVSDVLNAVWPDDKSCVVEQNAILFFDFSTMRLHDEAGNAVRVTIIRPTIKRVPNSWRAPTERFASKVED